MKRYLLVLFIFIFLFSPVAWGQGDQVVNNGDATGVIKFPPGGCAYSWTNSTPGIGLAASGTGNISSFTAVNTGNSAVTATIRATPGLTGNAYAANFGSNTVSVINTATDAVSATIPVGGTPVGVSISADGRRTYVTNNNSNTVSVIDNVTNMVVATIPVGSSPYGVSVSPDGTRVYVTNIGSASVSVINTATNIVIGNIVVGNAPLGISVSPDGSKVYAANEDDNTISVINTAANVVVATINLSTSPCALTVSPDGSKVYATDGGTAGTVSVISTSTNAVIATIAVGQQPQGISVSPDGNVLYVANTQSGSVSVINTNTNAVIALIGNISAPFSVSVSPDDSRVYVTNDNSPGTVTIINTATNAAIGTIPVGGNPISFGNFVTGGNECIPVQFTITVNPTPAASPTITAGAATGTISACAGTASASPQIQQFAVSGSNLTGNITATAPAGFEVSLAASGGYGNSVTIPQTAGTASSTVVYVRSAASDPAGPVSGKVNLTSSGATTQTVALAGIVNTLPMANPVANQSFTAGNLTTGVTFTGAANTFTWTNDTPGIGLAASGIGNIAPFTAVNTGTTPVIATITATPVTAGYLYIPYGATSVAVINNITNEVISTITVGQSPNGISVSPDGTRVYVANINDNTVSIITTSTNTVTATIPVGTRPLGLAVSPDGSRVYVANFVDGTVSVINATTNAVLSTVTVGQSPSGVVVSPDGSEVYVTNTGSGTVSVINTATNAVTAMIVVGSSPTGIALSPDGSRAYVANDNSGTVSVINTATNAVIATITTGNQPWGVAVSPDGSTVYVSNHVSNTVSVITTSTNTVTNTIQVGLQPVGVSISANGTRVYVANVADGTVSVIETAANSVIATIPVGSFPQPFGNFIMSGSGCSGVPVKFTITVNPTPSSVPNITYTAATGTNSTCAGTASASPNIQQVLVSGTNLTGAISLTAPNGFEISFSATTGFGNSLTITPVGGSVINIPVYVRLAAAAAVGSNSDNITGTSPGATTIKIPVTGTVNALPTVNTVTPQAFVNGETTTAINFTGTGNTFTWTNDTPGIGLATSGTGNIGSFTALNTGSNPVTATVTVTPTSSDFAYIANNTDGTISVVNTEADVVVAVIPVGSRPYGLVVSPNGSKVYVANQFSNSVSVINTVSNTVSTAITVGASPTCLALSPDGSVLYVTNQGDGTVSAINAFTNTVMSTFAAGTLPFAIAVSTDGGTLYVTNYNANSVLVMSAATHAIEATVPVGANPDGITLSPDGRLVYVANGNATYISVINASTNAVVGTVTTGHASNLLVSADGTRLYVADTGNGYITVINTANNSVLTTINTDRNPSFQSSNPLGLSMSPDGRFLYATLYGSESLAVISTATNAILITIPVGANPVSVGDFIKGGTGCAGAPTQFTITVKPNPSSVPNITSTTATGTNSTCAGTASASPNIQEVLVSGTNLTGSVSLIAPNGFEISFSATTGFGTGLITTPVGGAITNVPVYVRLAATAAVGINSGKMEGTSPGATTIEIQVTGTVNALPAVNTIAPQTFVNGETTTVTNFNGTGNIFSWTNNTPGIGLPASGTGSVPAFTAINTGTSPITATISVTPSSSGFAYIADYGSTAVSVVNTADNTVVANIPVMENPWGVAVSPDGSKVYVTNQGSNTVSVIDAATNSVTATINVGPMPEGVVVTPDGGTVYVANDEGTTLSVISTATNTVIAAITVGSAPQGLAISPDGTRLYAANAQSNTVSIINTSNNAVLTTVNVGINPFGVAVSPDGGNVYVTNLSSGTVSVISTATNTLTSTIVVGTNPSAVCVSPDGAAVYVSNGNANDISVINTTNNTVTTINPGITPDGLSLSGDGTLLYVNDFTNASVLVINTTNGNVVATIQVGQFPESVGNFVWSGSGCPGVPSTFTITINPTPSTSPTIVVNTATGSISACAGTASVSPQLEQFIVAGSKLTGDITATAPPGFEVSLNAGSGFGNTVTITESAGNVNNTVVYVRSSATALSGAISGNVVLSSPGAASQDVAVTGVVNDLPVVNSVNGQTTANGLTTTVVIFTGTGNVFNWTNDTPGIGLAATGSGNIVPFTAINQGNSPVIATVTVTPANVNSGCTGTPVAFTITVDPTPPTALNAAGVLPPLTTQYGTPSPSDTISVSGTSLTAAILVTPPAGFEISTDNVNFSNTLTIGGSGNVSAQNIYIRLAAITPVNPYSGNIKITSAGATDVNLAMPLSTVTPALLAIIADDKSKTFGAVNPLLTATYVGFVNFETPAILTTQALLATTATTASPVGQYPITVSGASSPNYIISPIPGTLTIEPTEQSIVIPNTFTPNGDGINDTWDIKFLNFYVNCSVDIFTRWGQKVYSSIGYSIPWDGTYKGSALPTGTYYYIINLKNGLNPLSGFVVIIH